VLARGTTLGLPGPRAAGLPHLEELRGDDRHGVPCYLLHGERSSGQYSSGTLVGAGESLGIGIDGFSATGT